MPYDAINEIQCAFLLWKLISWKTAWDRLLGKFETTIPIPLKAWHSGRWKNDQRFHNPKSAQSMNFFPSLVFIRSQLKYHNSIKLALLKLIWMFIVTKIFTKFNFSLCNFSLIEILLSVNTVLSINITQLCRRFSTESYVQCVSVNTNNIEKNLNLNNTKANSSFFRNTFRCGRHKMVEMFTCSLWFCWSLRSNGIWLLLMRTMTVWSSRNRGWYRQIYCVDYAKPWDKLQPAKDFYLHSSLTKWLNFFAKKLFSFENRI